MQMPVINKVFSLCTKGKISQPCARSLVLDGSEAWAVKEGDFTKLERNYMLVMDV